MTTFADWLRHYNNLDVGPFAEALDKMKDFYGERGVDICKDAVSLPGVALQYLLRGTAENKLYAPSKKAYDPLKAAVSGVPSIVFTDTMKRASQAFVHTHMRPPNRASEC